MTFQIFGTDHLRRPNPGDGDMAVTLRTRSALHERAHGCCEACGKPGATNAHHRINQSQGGPDTLSNLLLLCGSGTTGCHGIITTNPDNARLLGYTVSMGPVGKDYGPSAADVPVWRWSRELGWFQWVLLDDDGGIAPALVEVD